MRYIMKICRKCNKEKPLLEFCKNKNSRNGFENTCKQCAAERAHVFYRLVKPEFIEERFCIVCGNEFIARRKDKIYCNNKCRQHWSHPAKLKWIKNNPKKKAEYRKKWMSKNPGKNVEYCNKRRSLIANSKVHFTAKEWIKLLEQNNYKCVFCGTSRTIEADHIIPLALGGDNSIRNIQPLCRSCNAHKYNKILNAV